MPASKKEFDHLKGGSSASFLCNNLRLCPEKLNDLLYLSWIHNSVKSKSEVNMITFQNSQLKKPPDYKTYRLFYPEGDLVTVAKWLWLSSQKLIKKQKKIKVPGDFDASKESQLQGNMIFCLCSATGLVKLYSANGELLLMTKVITPTSSEKDKVTAEKDDHRESNICATSNGTDTIYFATRKGGLITVQPFGQYSKRFTQMEPMSQLEFNTKSRTLISATILGDIQVLDPNNMSILYSFNLSIQSTRNIASSITCMCCGNKYLLVGYMCGRIRLFDIAEKTLMVEIASHTRSVSAIDLCERTGYFVSVSEDTFINVYKYVNYSNGGLEVNVAMSKQVANAVLVGVQLVHSTLLKDGNETNTQRGVFFTHYDSVKVGMIPVTT